MVVNRSQASAGIVCRSASCAAPTDTHPYCDKVQFWPRKPLDRARLAWLKCECGRGGVYAHDQPARFDASYRQRVELRQPSDKALRWLATCDEALINRVEITLDFIFESLAERDDTSEFLHRHLVRRWHNKNQQIRIYMPEADDYSLGGTRYDAGGRSQNRAVLYRETHSRITGEINCLHLEWRLNGLKAVRAAGIETFQDLLEFNHRVFWQKRLRLYNVDRRRLGRMVRNKASGGKRRAAEIHPSGTDLDGRTGEVLVRAYDTVQELIDNMRAHIKVSRALVPISIEHLSPR